MSDNKVNTINHCKLSNPIRIDDHNYCHYPICYEKKSNGKLDYDGKKYIFRNSSENNIFQEYTEEADANKNNCSNTNCGSGGTWDSSRCTIIKPCQIDNTAYTKDKCIFDDKDRCCKDSSGNLTGQFCNPGQFCNNGKCIQKNCKGDNGLECSGNGKCVNGKCICNPPGRNKQELPCCWRNTQICEGKDCATWNDSCQ